MRDIIYTSPHYLVSIIRKGHRLKHREFRGRKKVILAIGIEPESGVLAEPSRLDPCWVLETAGGSGAE